MEPGPARDRRSSKSGSYAFAGSTWTTTSRLSRICRPSQSVWLSSLAYPESFHPSFRSRPRRFSLPTLPQLPEPQLLRLRPTSLRTQDISHLLTGVFRNLYTAEVFGDDVSTNLIKARGSEDDVHEEFVDELQQVTRAPGPAPPRAPYWWGPSHLRTVLGAQDAPPPPQKVAPPLPPAVFAARQV